MRWRYGAVSTAAGKRGFEIGAGRELWSTGIWKEFKPAKVPFRIRDFSLGRSYVIVFSGKYGSSIWYRSQHECSDRLPQVSTNVLQYTMVAEPHLKSRETKQQKRRT